MVSPMLMSIVRSLRPTLSILSTLALTVFSTGLLAGCSEDSEAATAKGTVTLDGQPLTSGLIKFEPTGGGTQAGLARITENGTWTARVSRSLVGLVPGDYTVTVESTGEVAAGADADAMSEGPVSLVPNKYTNSETSPLTLKIEPGENNDIALELVSDNAGAAE